MKSDANTNWTTTTVERTFGTSPCSTNTCEVNKTFARSTSMVDRLANVYYTANSAITQIATWSGNLDTEFRTTSEATDGTGTLRVQYDNQTPEVNQFRESEWQIELGYSMYASGGNTRHELGHAVHAGILDRAQEVGPDPDVDCNSYNFNNEGGHGETTCEYVQASTQEGLATFFGVRSIVTGTAADKDAWFCFCKTTVAADQDMCSDVATPVSGLDADRNQDCGAVDPEQDGRGFYGVGDTFAEELTHCTRLTVSGSNGCNCTDSGGDGVCDGTWYQNNGERNETQVVRYFWDVVDTNDDSGTVDDTDESIFSLVADMEGMTCTAGSGFNTDHTCNEPNRASGGSCNPATDGNIPGSFSDGNRDSYNAVDISQLITGSQFDEQVINCITGSLD